MNSTFGGTLRGFFRHFRESMNNVLVLITRIGADANLIIHEAWLSVWLDGDDCELVPAGPTANWFKPPMYF